MRKAEIKLYQFNELPENVQERIIEKSRYTLVEDQSWYEPILEGFIEDMKELDHDISGKDVRFSGFYNQGDGASFTTENGSLDAKSLIDSVKSKVASLPANFTKELNEGLINFELRTMDTRYCHPNTVRLDYSYDGDNPKIEIVLDEMVDMILDYLRDKMNELYRSLKNEFQGLLSDESIAEEVFEREDEYFENGELYSH
tara:strand:- start:2208 stop:2807 length:600 start_codon:yes stop_codon:yes gene_type:complete